MKKQEDISVEELDLPEGIKSYLNKINYNLPIPLNNLEEMLCKVRCFTGLTKEKTEIAIKYLLEEIRNIIISGKRVSFYTLGSLSLNKNKKILITHSGYTLNRKKEFERR